MQHDCVAVLDVGKTLSKLSIWSEDNVLLERRVHRNSRVLEGGIPVLDTKGITFWLAQTLAVYSRLARISAIVPVGHGAAACIVDEQKLLATPLDYEAEPPSEITDRYRSIRDPFEITGSPALPMCLNLGVQLFWREFVDPDRMRRGTIVTWPQYWAWRLCGVAATEVTSLGCHTDLWMPIRRSPSPLAVARGWADRLAPVHLATDVLGTVTKEWQERCGLPADCAVVCGIHDSNSALHATRAYPEIEGRECTVLSTGTWFVAMRTLGATERFGSVLVPENRDCLINCDVAGRPVPSSRFMGGRELELLEASIGEPADPSSNAETFESIALTLARAGVFALPSFNKGVGPFPNHLGRWILRPADQIGRRAIAGLYLALMADTSLNLIGSREALVIEGRFGSDPIFTRALASLRPKQTVHLSDPNHSIPLGAIRLVRPNAPPQCNLRKVQPMPGELPEYAAKWSALAQISD